MNVKIGWGVLLHPLYNPDLTASDFHLFGPLKTAHYGIHFKDDEAGIKFLHEWQDHAFYQTRIHGFVKRCVKTVEKVEDYVEHDTLSIKCEVFMQCKLHLNFLKIKGEKNRRHCILTDLRTYIYIYIYIYMSAKSLRPPTLKEENEIKLKMQSKRFNYQLKYLLTNTHTSRRKQNK